MKRVIKTTNTIISLLLGLLGFTNCNNTEEYGMPHADYTVKGKITDNVTKKPIKGIMVRYEEPRAVAMYGTISTTYQPKSAVSEDNGDYKLTESSINSYIPNLPDSKQEVYFYDIDGEENGLYRDTVVVVDFKEAEQTKKGKSWYRGEFTVTENIELKQAENE